MTFDANDAATGVDGIRREILTWDEFGDAARSLAGDVLRSGFQPDVVIAIARGGLLLAGAISYALGTKACGSINVEFYSGIDERLPEPVLHPPMFDAPALGGKRVLLVDDVSDSGRTLAKVVAIIRDGGDVRVERTGGRGCGHERGGMIARIPVSDRDHGDARLVAPGAGGTRAGLREERVEHDAVGLLEPATAHQVHAHAAPSTSTTGGSADHGKTIQSSVRR